MKLEKYIRTLSVICYCIFTFLSCESKVNSITNIKVPNDSIVGRAILRENSSSVDYSPKGNFIKVIIPDSGLWKNIILKKSNNLIKSKYFFDDNDITFSYLFDSLDFGEYNVKYISELNDTIEEKLNFNKNIELRFPKKINDFYNELKLDELNINNFNQNDTLQLLYQHYGCFGTTDRLLEFIFKNDKDIVLRKGVDSDDRKKSKNKWVNIENENLKEYLLDFISKTKHLDSLDRCSSDMIYVFRNKNNNSIVIVEDNSCDLRQDIYNILTLD